MKRVPRNRICYGETLKRTEPASSRYQTLQFPNHQTFEPPDLRFASERPPVLGAWDFTRSAPPKAWPRAVDAPVGRWEHVTWTSKGRGTHGILGILGPFQETSQACGSKARVGLENEGNRGLTCCTRCIEPRSHLLELSGAAAWAWTGPENNLHMQNWQGTWVPMVQYGIQCAVSLSILFNCSWHPGPARADIHSICTNCDGGAGMHQSPPATCNPHTRHAQKNLWNATELVELMLLLCL